MFVPSSCFLAVVEVGGRCGRVCCGRGVCLLWLRAVAAKAVVAVAEVGGGGVGLGGGLRRLRLLWWRSAAAEVYGWCCCFRGVGGEAWAGRGSLPWSYSLLSTLTPAQRLSSLALLIMSFALAPNI